MPFVYYIPDASKLSIEQLRGLGLGYAFEDRVHSALVVNGPDGTRGHVYGDQAALDGQQLGYFRERQTWAKIPPGIAGHAAHAWIGLAKDVALKPRELAREQQLDGHWIRLADGQKWLVPVARKSLPTEDDALRYCIALPHVAGLDDEGQWTSVNVLARYAPLWQTAQRFWEALILGDIAEDAVRLDFAEVLDAAVLALAANYRLGKLESSLLNILTQEHAASVLQALVDWPTVLAWSKKKMESAGAGSSIASGPPAGIPTIAPPAPIAGR